MNDQEETEGSTTRHAFMVGGAAAAIGAAAVTGAGKPADAQARLVDKLVASATSNAVTMGYFTRSELAFHYALADAFTICDAYHCSVLGPTDPNRLMALSASIDPAGAHGGPVLTTASDRVAMTGKLNSHRDTGRRHRLPAAGQQLDAGSRGNSSSAQRAVAGQRRFRELPGAAP